MTLTLRPEFEQFIDEQVKAGHYPTAEAVVEAAMAGLVEPQSGEPLTAEDIASIDEADAQAERGEGVDLDVFRAEMMNRIRVSG